MLFKTTEEVMPWVGLYVGVASLVCTLAMAADAFQGFRKRKLWFPCKYFTVNAASITMIGITMKLSVDLTTIKPLTSDLDVKPTSIFFLITMLANFLPSLGLMDDKELLLNMIALGILIITIVVNMFIQIAACVFVDWAGIFMLPLVLVFSVALTVPASRRIIERQYKELHGFSSNHQETNFSSKELVHTVKKYWMMAETGNPQFVIACSQVSSAFGVVCLSFSLFSSLALLSINDNPSYGNSDYKWSIKVIIIVQSIGVVVGSIAPTFRCFTIISYFNLSKKWSVNHVNMFRVEGQWTQRLQQWKHSHIHSDIPGRHCKKVFHIFRNVILNLCIAIQIMVVVLCKIICLVPRSFLILLSYCWYLFKSFLKSFKKEQHSSNKGVRLDMKEYTKYVLQIEDEATISESVLRKTLNSITRLIRASEKKDPANLLQFLQKSTSFNGVVEFDNDRVPPLHSEITHSWSLAVVTLTAIILALPKIANNDFKSLLASIKEGLRFVKHIEEMLYVKGDLVKSRKAARRVWTEVEVHHKWLQIDLQKKSRNGKMSKEVLRWLSDEAVKIVINFKSCKKTSLADSLHKFLVASSMYRISEAIFLHCNEQENWPNDDELFKWISTLIADLLLACFTNLPRVIKMKCHHDAIEKREDSIQTAAKLLGKSKKILKILEERQLPNLNVDSMAYIDKWNALSKSDIPNGASSIRTQPASSSSSESLIVAIV